MGIIAALLSAIFSTSKDLVSKKLSFSVDGTTSTFASFAFALPFYLVLLAGLYLAGFESFVIGTSFLLLVLLRAITDAAAEWLKMTALGLGEISLVVCFFSLSPIFLLIASPVLTGDPLSLGDVLGMFVVVLGSIIILHNPKLSLAPSGKDSGTRGKAILLAILASFFFALNTCFDRLAVQEASAALSGFAMTALSALFFLPSVFTPARRNALKSDFKAFMLRGGLEVGFMVLKLLALQYLTATEVVGLQRCSMVLSVLGGWLFFGEKEIGRRLVGAVVIVVGSLITLLV